MSNEQDQTWGQDILVVKDLVVDQIVEEILRVLRSK